MTRKAREKSSSGIYHIMMRGINRQLIFEEEGDKVRFLETLKKYKSISKYEIYSYCLMDNHIHILMKEVEETVSEAIKRISSSYVYWYNRKYERCGHLFQDRYKSENVENTAYFLTVLRYIHQNPIKAGLENSVLDSKWTSINEYIGEGDLVDTDFGLHQFSLEKSEAIKLFIEYMHQRNDDQCLDVTVKTRISDNEVWEELHKLGIPNMNTLQQMDKKSRDAILVTLKQLNGLTVRQLSRLTGISKSVIHRVH